MVQGLGSGHGGWGLMLGLRKGTARLYLNRCQDLDQLTQIFKVTGVPGADFVQKLKDKSVSGCGPELGSAAGLADRAGDCWGSPAPAMACIPLWPPVYKPSRSALSPEGPDPPPSPGQILHPVLAPDSQEGLHSALPTCQPPG